jgi:hypothetical protein
MRAKAEKLIRIIADGDDDKYKEMKASWKGLPWTEKTKIREYVESKSNKES